MTDYLIETHMHTSEVSPCGRVDAAEGIRIYKELGYHAVVITDHFFTGFFERLHAGSWREMVDGYLAGYRRACEEGAKAGIRVILGMEFCVPEAGDDILVYGFDEKFLYDHENLYLADPETLGRIASENGMLLIQAHPFRSYITRTYDEIIEGVEAYNGNPRQESNNERAAAYATAKGIIAISGSDFHQRGDAGRGGIHLPVLPGDSREFACIIREEKTPRLIMNERPSYGSLLSRLFGKSGS